MTIHTDHSAPGVATVHLGLLRRRLTYRCDPSLHRVTVSDEFDRIAFAFGGRGKGLGLLHTPIDLAFVRPEFSGECLPTAGPDAVWVAVADYGNRRVQIFEMDGAFVGSVDTGEELDGPPCGLAWRSPMLEVEGIEGARARIHLTSALLCAGNRVHVASRPPREWLPARTWIN